MRAANNRRREPAKASSDAALLVLALAIIAAVGVVWVSVSVGSHLAGVNPSLPRNPLEQLTGLARGSVVWPVASTLVAAVCTLLLACIGGFVAWIRIAGSRGRTTVDRMGRFMATPRSLAHLQLKQATAKSARLGVPASPGIPLGQLLAGAQTVYASFEDMLILIAGPRVGKSTSLVIPAIAAAPGAVVTTSNKRDVVDATRNLRAEAGRVWVFDPQGVAGEAPTWWWNPLSYVTDDTRAAKLAQHFAAGTTAPGARTDAYFDGKGQNLLAGLLLAAAEGDRPITDVYEWLTNSGDTTPLDLLDASRYTRIAEAVRAVQLSTEKQRDGIYSSAERMAACLANTAIEPWVNPTLGGDVRPTFNPREFVTASGTLYSLSKEGVGTAGPLVTALTAATIEAAEELAARSPGGRLPTPLIGILDEAANVCRWTDLPDLYSHFGSRGIPILSVFQSYSQGVAVFGRDGMRKLWSASNIKLYAGGVSEPEFLSELADLIGTYDRETTTASLSRGIRSTSTSLKRDRILEVAELADLPRGRAILFSSGARAALLRTVPWYAGPHAAAIKASLAAHDLSAAPR